LFTALTTGFFLGLSLIVAIGAQNAFVLRQGILRKHVFYIALFCALSDSILIIIGVLGISYFLNDFIREFERFIFGFSALWLVVYGFLRILSAIRLKSSLIDNNSNSDNFLSAISIVAIFTFANPHVYLDTVILIGSISQQFMEMNRIYFTVGACLASFVWFFTIAYGAKLLTPIMKKPSHWRIFDLLIALIMFVIAFNLASEGNWI
jgi:L-lysine exporter family protein LysE/ArgO